MAIANTKTRTDFDICSWNTVYSNSEASMTIFDATKGIIFRTSKGKEITIPMSDLHNILVKVYDEV